MWSHHTMHMIPSPAQLCATYNIPPSNTCTRLQYLLEEAKERQEVARLEGKSEAEQEFYKERADGRQALSLARKKQEELEFRLCQKEEEIRNISANKSGEQQSEHHQRALREEVKKRELVQFEREQLKDQLEQYKHQNRGLQQQVESMRTAAERDKRERDRTLLEEKAKTEQLRLRMENEHEQLVSGWRKEFEGELAAHKDALNKRMREAETLKKELKHQLAGVEDKVAERTGEELQRLSELETELRKQETVQEEMEAALAARQQTIEINEAYIEEEDARLRSDMQEIETRRAGLEKEKEELDERLYFVDMDAKKTQEKFNELELKMIKLNTENRALRDENEGLQQQIRSHKSRASMIPLPSSRSISERTISERSSSRLASPSKRTVVGGSIITGSKENASVMASNIPSLVSSIVPPMKLNIPPPVEIKPDPALTERPRSSRRYVYAHISFTYVVYQTYQFAYVFAVVCMYAFMLVYM